MLDKFWHQDTNIYQTSFSLSHIFPVLALKLQHLRQAKRNSTKHDKFPLFIHK